MKPQNGTLHALCMYCVSMISGTHLLSSSVASQCLACWPYISASTTLETFTVCGGSSSYLFTWVYSGLLACTYSPHWSVFISLL